MAKIHMETEEVRCLAQLMARQADRFMEKSESLSRACGRLSGAWSGGSRSERYLSKLRGLTKKFESQSYALQQLSVRVNREVDEWVEKDSSFKFNYKKIVMTKIGTSLRIVADATGKIKDTVTIGKGLKALIAGGSVIAALKPSLGPLDVAVATVDFSGRAIEDWQKYDKGSEKAAAISLDAVFVTAKTLLISYGSYHLAVAAMTLAAPVLATVGAPVAVGGLVVGLIGLGVWAAINFGGSALADYGFDLVKDKAVHAGGELIDNVCASASSLKESIVKRLDFLPKQIDNSFSNAIRNLKSI